MTEFEQLFCQNRDFIFKYLVKLTRNSILAEELTQETFFRAYMNFSSLREKEKAGAWLCQIAKNAYFAHCKTLNKTDSLEDSTELPGGENLEESFVQKELSKEAFTALHGLPEPYKEVFMLSVLGDFSFKDISSLFGKSESWARVTFYRAKQKLLEKMR